MDQLNSITLLGYINICSHRKHKQVFMGKRKPSRSCPSFCSSPFPPHPDDVEGNLNIENVCKYTPLTSSCTPSKTRTIFTHTHSDRFTSNHVVLLKTMNPSKWVHTPHGKWSYVGEMRKCFSHIKSKGKRNSRSFVVYGS